MVKTWQKLKKNPQFFKTFYIREKIIAAIREFFLNYDYHEVEVPLLAAKLPAESYVEVFETQLFDRQRRPKRAFLTTSPEMFLKKLLVAGIGNCFTITKSFRNTETGSNLHNPEFTILEWYEVNADYQDLIRTTEKLFINIFKTLNWGKSLRLTYHNFQINLTPPWERLSMKEAFSKFAKINLEQALNFEGLKKISLEKGYQVGKTTTWEELFNQIYLNEIEPNLGQERPTFIYDFPTQLAALAQKKKSDTRYAERFELYIAGLELGDGYTELTEWKEQEARFKKEALERERLGKIDYPYDKDFIEALKTGLPKCAGLALGVDRTVMLFANAPKIQDTLFFPASEMWPEKERF